MRLFAAAAAACLAGSAHAQSGSPTPTRPETLNQLVACRSLTDPAARLACYDRAVGALDTAQRQGDVVVVDRDQVRQARRQLFGFELPSVSLFEQNGQPEAMDSIATTLTRAVMTGDDRWTFTLGDGSVWRQIDGERVNFRNRPGVEVHVRRAALGSYLLAVDGSRGVRVRRQ